MWEVIGGIVLFIDMWPPIDKEEQPCHKLNYQQALYETLCKMSVSLQQVLSLEELQLPFYTGPIKMWALETMRCKTSREQVIGMHRFHTMRQEGMALLSTCSCSCNHLEGPIPRTWTPLCSGQSHGIGLDWRWAHSPMTSTCLILFSQISIRSYKYSSLFL